MRETLSLCIFLPLSLYISLDQHKPKYFVILQNVHLLQILKKNEEKQFIKIFIIL